jgi:hypothetical protein
MKRSPLQSTDAPVSGIARLEAPVSHSSFAKFVQLVAGFLIQAFRMLHLMLLES